MKVDDKVTTIGSIAELLESINMGETQKHPSFHIIKFEEAVGKMPSRINYTSGSHFEITVARNSQTDVSIDGAIIEKDMDVINFMSPGQTIDINRSSSTTEGYLLFFNADFLNFSPTIYNLIQRFPYFNMHYSPVYYLSPGQSEQFFETMEKMYLKFNQPDQDDFEMIKAYLSIILFETKKLSSEWQSRFHSRAEEITYRFENLLKNPDRKGFVRDYAEELNVSPVYLSECVKVTTGKSAKRVITEYKIREAKSLLSYSEMTIDEISRKVGFDDRSNFVNFFKNNVGIAPRRFRMQNSGM